MDAIQAKNGTNRAKANRGRCLPHRCLPASEHRSAAMANVNAAMEATMRRNSLLLATDLATSLPAVAPNDCANTRTGDRGMRKSVAAAATALMLAVAQGVLFAATGTATAAPVFYTSEASFQTDAGNAGIGLGTETLDAFPTSDDLSTNPSSANGITVSSDDAAALGMTFGAGSGQVVTFTTDTAPGGTSIIFAFASPINAFGIDIFGFGDVPGSPSTLTLTTANGSQLVLESDGSLDFGNQLFAGVIDVVPFSSATLTATTLSLDGVTLDDVQFGPVPEPATLGLVAAGLASLGLRARRRRLAAQKR
jgi:hypothetical protein